MKKKMQFSRVAASATGLIGLMTAGAAAQPCLPELTALPGFNNTVHGVAVFDDGTGEALYAGGLFTEAGGVPVSRVARWDGTSWSDVGGGFNQTVWTTPVVFDDGTGPALYVGGGFTEAGGNPADRIARWDGQTWTEVGGGAGGVVFELGVFDLGSGPELYAGGAFSAIGGVAANRVARWDGQNWHALGDGVASTVRAFELFDDGTGTQLYVGGVFSNAAGLPDTNRLARWDGQNWSAVPGATLNNTVLSLRTFDDGSGMALYVFGQFTTTGGAPGQRVARWDGQTWDPLGAGATGNPGASIIFDYGAGPELYVGGGFGTIDNVPDTSRLARWNGQAWRPVGPGLRGPSSVNSFAIFDDGNGAALYTAGTFLETLTGEPLERIARWGCPPAAPCYADCNGDGALNISDFTCFIDAFAIQDPYADCDGNGAFNIADFLCFIDEFSIGCP